MPPSSASSSASPFARRLEHVVERDVSSVGKRAGHPPPRRCRCCSHIRPRPTRTVGRAMESSRRQHQETRVREAATLHRHCRKQHHRVEQLSGELRRAAERVNSDRDVDAVTARRLKTTLMMKRDANDEYRDAMKLQRDLLRALHATLLKTMQKGRSDIERIWRSVDSLRRSRPCLDPHSLRRFILCVPPPRCSIRS